MDEQTQAILQRQAERAAMSTESYTLQISLSNRSTGHEAKGNNPSRETNTLFGA